MGGAKLSKGGAIRSKGGAIRSDSGGDVKYGRGLRFGYSVTETVMGL